MKKFYSPDTWGEKVNFVDENNVFVGYNLDQQCCEEASYIVTDSLIFTRDDYNSSRSEPEWENYNFDPEFFREASPSFLDDGAVATFKLIGPDIKYLHIFNGHNGYYSHGFNTKGFTETPEEDYL